jgi:osmotically-inducible protein OsmY
VRTGFCEKKIVREEHGMVVVEQSKETRLDEPNRDRDPAKVTTEDQNRNRSVLDLNSVQNKVLVTGFEELIYVGQAVFLSDDRSIGCVINLLPGDGNPLSYLVIHPGHFWNRSKIIPVGLVSAVHPEGIRLSIDRSKFQELPNFRTDASIADEVDRALWNDEVLRVTAYHEIDLRVKNGIVSINGHIISLMSQDRIESAVGKVKGILGVRIHLIADDKLLHNVAAALGPIEQVEGNRVFTKVQYGVVLLSGEVISPDARNIAGHAAANVPGVRGVINMIAAPGVDLDKEDQLFLQPSIGEEIFFRDGQFGFVKHVIIDPNNRRVVAMIVQGRFPDKQLKAASLAGDYTAAPERLAIIPVSVIRYLTNTSGFLLIDSTETTRYQEFNPAGLRAPNEDWVPPYPYSYDDVRFFAK